MLFGVALQVTSERLNHSLFLIADTRWFADRYSHKAPMQGFKHNLMTNGPALTHNSSHHKPLGPASVNLLQRSMAKTNYTKLHKI